MHEHDARPSADVVEAARRQLDEVVQFGGHLDARRTAADDDEGQQLLAARRVVLQACLLEHVEGPIAQVERVAQRAHADGMLGHARHGAEVGHAAQGHDQRFVGDVTASPPERRRRRTCARGGVDALDDAHLDRHAREHPPQGHDDVGRLDGARDDVGQQRLEDEVVVAVEQHDLDALRRRRPVPRPGDASCAAAWPAPGPR